MKCRRIRHRWIQLLRDGVMAVEDQSAIFLGLRENGTAMTDVRYILSDGANEYVVEEGESITENVTRDIVLLLCSCKNL